MARMHDVTFDCAHPASLARFWATALDEYALAPYDEAELERLRGMGVHDVEDDPGVVVEGPPGTPRLYFQLVPEPKRIKNRVHLDLRCADPENESARLVAAGATVLATYERLTVFGDPEGNEFCLGWVDPILT
ncbi:MAG: VOC family protein [Actinomycetota bacterium]